jgi:hypoxanthine phosphoribosyltransferase
VTVDPAAAPEKVVLTFETIASRLRRLLDATDLRHVDEVVAVARGGVVAGALVAYHLRRPLHVVRSRFRDDANVPLDEVPHVTAEPLDLRGRHVLVVDDVSVTGATLRAVAAALGAEGTTTLVLKGRPGAADHVVFDDVPSCVVWPWAVDGMR